MNASLSKKLIFFLLCLHFSVIFAEEQDSANDKFYAVTFLKNLLNDQYPLRFDFGAEPHRHGSMIFGAVTYDWGDVFSSTFRIEYDHYNTSNNAVNELENSEVRAISLMPFPVVFFFGNDDIHAMSPFTQLGFGFYFQNSRTESLLGEFFSDTEYGAGFVRTEGITKYQMYGPSFSITMDIPIQKYVSIILDGFFVPAYYISIDSSSDMNFYVSDQTIPYTYSVNSHTLSAPYLKQSVGIDFFKYIRLKMLMSYMHTDMRTISVAGEASTPYEVHSITLRYGGEILKPSKTRKKSSHLWAGLYYEVEWSKYVFRDSTSTEQTGRWVLCFGK